MGAPLSVPASEFHNLTPTTTGSHGHHGLANHTAHGSGARSIPVGVPGFDFEEETTITLWSGMNSSTGEDGSANGLLIFPFDDTLPVYQRIGEQLALTDTGFGTTFTYTFNTSTTIPRQIYVTNSGFEPFCLAGLSIEYYDGLTITIPGTLGRICDVDHYESQAKIDKNDPHPACTWIDKDGAPDQILGLFFDISRGNLRARSSDDNTSTDTTTNTTNTTTDTTTNATTNTTTNTTTTTTTTLTRDMCGPPYINKVPAGKGLPDPTWPEDGLRFEFGDHLVKSTLSTTSAKHMCNSKFSTGPDLANLEEKLYCDMDAKKLYPICEAGTEGVCFDFHTEELVEQDGGDEAHQGETGEEVDGGPTRREAVGVSAGKTTVKVLKRFHHVQVWD